jgi:hypothetical protein
MVNHLLIISRTIGITIVVERTEWRRSKDMADLEPTRTKNFGGANFADLPWSRAAERLRAGGLGKTSSFLSTVRPDGTPHATRVGAIWHAGDLYFVTGATSRKGRNLADNPASTITASLEGIDISLVGEATRVLDPALLQRIADHYVAIGWPAEVTGDVITAPYNALSAGPAPWNVYRFTFHTAFGEATAEPYGATRWSFAR